MDPKTELKLEQGQKYLGYGYINMYGEFVFEPQQKGKNAGRSSLLREGDGWSVYTTKENIIVHMKIPRGANTLLRIMYLTRLMDKIIEIFRSYNLDKEKE